MKGHIRTAGRDVFDVVINLGRDENGRRKQHWKRVRGNRKAAEAECAKMIYELSTGAFVEPSRAKVSEFLDRWIEHVRTKTARRTLDRYEQIVKHHLKPTLGNYKLQNLRPLHVQNALAAWLKSGRVKGKKNPGLSPQTVRHHFAVLKEALGCAVRWGMVVRNVCDAVEPPKVPFREVEPLTDVDLAKLLQAVRGNNLEGPIWLAATTGLRRGEILGLSWSDVDLESGSITVRRTLQQGAKGETYFKEPKSVASRRKMALSPIAVERLRSQKARQAEGKMASRKTYREDLDLVFAQADGSPWKPDTFSRTFSLFLSRHKMRQITFHALRHGFATALARQGVHPRVAQRLLGHSDPRITMAIYSH